ncbi:hypothetical protein LQ953_05690 [Sphingomonas sp. IC-56]|uniref:hypothetical protein n=1 Tax=Sphingomonas sp. IC-56 TaxID=2898529 RepID=UPI001E39CDF8|nr:hypothetical protein [Sphingomonas sp. IC-56]MCD2323506.1 hypothetical protein [Sphingomonas sp. IC-56]
MPLYGLIPAAMLVMGFVAAVAALIGRQKGAGRALIAMLALFGFGLCFDEPSTPDGAHLRPFPSVVLVLLLTFPVIAASAILNGVIRLGVRVARARNGK